MQRSKKVFKIINQIFYKAYVSQFHRYFKCKDFIDRASLLREIFHLISLKLFIIWLTCMQNSFPNETGSATLIFFSLIPYLTSATNHVSCSNCFPSRATDSNLSFKGSILFKRFQIYVTFLQCYCDVFVVMQRSAFSIPNDDYFMGVSSLCYGIVNQMMNRKLKM